MSFLCNGLELPEQATAFVLQLFWCPPLTVFVLRTPRKGVVRVPQASSRG